MKVFSISIGIGVVKGVLISLTAISSFCDFSVCTFECFKSIPCNACNFYVFKEHTMECNAVVSFIRMLRDFQTYIFFLFFSNKESLLCSHITIKTSVSCFNEKGMPQPWWKIEILDYVAEHPELGCRKLAEHFSIGKTAIANILKKGKTLRKDLEFFKGTCIKASSRKIPLFFFSFFFSFLFYFGKNYTFVIEIILFTKSI